MTTAANTTMRTDETFTVCVEGNVGTNLASILKYFSTRNDVCVIPQPVEKWTDWSRENKFPDMYTSQDAWRAPYQSHVTMSMLEQHQRLTSKPIRVLERSVHSSRFCYIPYSYWTRRLFISLRKDMQSWCSYVDDVLKVPVDMIVYLRSNPDVLHKQQVESNSTSISLDYLRELHTAHDMWLLSGRMSHNIPIVVMHEDADMSRQYAHIDLALANAGAYSSQYYVQNPE